VVAVIAASYVARTAAPTVAVVAPVAARGGVVDRTLGGTTAAGSRVVVRIGDGFPRTGHPIGVRGGFVGLVAAGTGPVFAVGIEVAMAVGEAEGG
jgi:hypothetical protein